MNALRRTREVALFDERDHGPQIPRRKIHR
jgi:hypothetical protein